ncbi:hypothetical protein HHK36_024270 [Tetracentron sinense]|uniref:Uncharacterized protein n=1 Tax=Tetracentron sinense TaxID=13715 RepID=A0A834YQA1_TETSI|nr:hypothetical protein HHK36_024270 [Tetracentron sinense]
MANNENQNPYSEEKKPQWLFFAERKKAQNRFLRMFSGLMSRDYDSSDGSEFATLIAAAAFAINSLEEADSQNQKNMSEDLVTSLTKVKSRKEDSITRLPDTGRVSRRFSGKDEKDEKQYPGKASIKKPEGLDRVTESAVIKKKPSFDDQYLNATSMKPEHVVDTGRPNPPPARPGSAGTIADAWEKAEINFRYEKTNSTIHSRENDKKKKAKRQMDRTEVLL